MNTSKISAMLSFAAMIMITTHLNGQVITTKTISLEAAKKVTAEAVKYAKANNAPGGAIAVVDNGGNFVFFQKFNKNFFASSESANKKNKNFSTFKAPSFKLKKEIN